MEIFQVEETKEIQQLNKIPHPRLDPVPEEEKMLQRTLLCQVTKLKQIT